MDGNNKFLASIIYIIRKNKTYFYIFNKKMQANYLKNKKRRPGVVLTPGKKV